ncbi:DDE-type integrase/transposase/recombinase [Mesosutterella porci]|nr:DDE-type integrase/transposase/recombinase [Mesosutterella sp. oilRF-744-WT-GAM-9]
MYLSPIMDLYSREIVGLACGTSQSMLLIKAMLDDFKQNMDARGVSLAGSLLHSDMGWQYQHGTYRSALARMGMRQSISRKGNCLDRAIIEIFFGRLKMKLFYGQERKFKTAQELIDALPAMIRWYNRSASANAQAGNPSLNTLQNMKAPAGWRALWDKNRVPKL